ncbi:MAG TPA: sigma-70 family RNA polymerase sigma factor [bacterium]|nr:sigma-70 family RNA polymerase sigma factor [bacterium]
MSTGFLSSLSFSGNLFPSWVSYLVEQWGAFFAAWGSGGNAASRHEDQAMIQEALSGDPGFEKLVKAHERMVYRVAFRFLNNEPDAMDVTQDVFIRVHRSLAKFRGDSSLSTWIYTITANLSRNAIRSRKNREKVQVLAPEEREDQTPFWDRVADNRGGLAYRQTESRDLNGAIQESLQGLPSDYREAVILRDLEDLDYQEIAKVLETSVGTVKSRIARGRAILREKLKDWL